MASFLEAVLRRQVWMKGRVVAGMDPSEWRHDEFGSLIRWDDYGNRNSDFGWEIDHVLPLSLGGADHLGNMRPLHCRRNAGFGGMLGGMFRR
jgi:hypothetical protein